MYEFLIIIHQWVHNMMENIVKLLLNKSCNKFTYEIMAEFSPDSATNASVLEYLLIQSNNILLATSGPIANWVPLPALSNCLSNVCELSNETSKVYLTTNNQLQVSCSLPSSCCFKFLPCENFLCWNLIFLFKFVARSQSLVKRTEEV